MTEVERAKRLLAGESEFQLGDRVIYIPAHAAGDRNNKDCQSGVVSSYVRVVHTNLYVFVKYDNATQKMITGDEPCTATATNEKNLVHE